jgi:hypothetical protein
MKMEARLAVIAFCDIADQAQHFALFVDVDRLVILGGQIEPADIGGRKRPDCSDRSALEILPIGKITNGLEGFLTLVEDKNKNSLCAFCDGFRFHGLPSIRGLQSPLLSAENHFRLFDEAGSRVASC